MRTIRNLLAAMLLLGACSGSPATSPLAATDASGTSSVPSASPATPAPATSAPATHASTPAASAAATATATATAAPFAWARLPGDGPAAREDHTWTVDESGEAAWLFGGRDGRTELDDLWRYDLATDGWEEVAVGGEVPAARFGHGAAWLPGTGLVVWAGQAGTSFFDDLWAFDPEAGEWRALTSTGDVPPARYGSCLALGPDGRLWVSHGFTADAGRFGDTRAWDPGSGAWSDETPSGAAPVVRCLHDCLWTPDGRLLVYAGQTTGVAAIGDLWSFSDGTWEQAAEPEPPARQLYALAQSGARAWVFGGGGVDRRALGDLWQLDLASLAWTPLEPSGEAPAARLGAASVVDEARARMLLWGGHAGEGAFADLWALPLPL